MAKSQWYKEMSVYQIWPRSFCDSDGDGIGDLKGILSKLDYIKSIGVDAIWFSPLYPSPQKDYGYDIADYKNINPEYGTLEDFKTVLDEAHKRGLKVIMDLVVNHTSDQNKWFLESRKSRNNEYSDYYIWRDGRKNGKKPPNNWLSTFQGKAWEYCKERGQYYLHVFAKEQPDLNMDNPKVREEVKDIMRFWLDMGVDGFREDVITFISKKEGLPNGFPLPVATGIEHYMNGPHLREYLSEFRKVTDEYDCFTVGEAPMMTPSRALKFIKEGDGQLLDMMFHFQHMGADNIVTNWILTPFRPGHLKNVFAKWQKKMAKGGGWNALYLENHDQPRVVSRYGSEKYRVESAKMLASMCFLQSGTPFIYMGQEIGMTNAKEIDSLETYKDVSTINNFGMFKALGFSEKNFLKVCHRAARDNARTSMQWDDSPNAGFTTGTPWFYTNPNYKQINVKAAEADENSILNYYRKLLKFRKENDIVKFGSFKMLKTCPRIFAYVREYQGDKMLVINSFSDGEIAFRAPEDFDMSKAELVLSNYESNPVIHNGFMTKPYETRTYLLKK